MNQRETIVSPVDVVGVVSVLLRSARWLAASLVSGLVVGYCVSLLPAKQFKAEATLIPVSEDKGKLAHAVSGPLTDLSVLATMFGGDVHSHRAQILATARSREFARLFIEENGLLAQIYPEEESSPSPVGRLLPREPPSMNDAVKIFRKQIFKIAEDRRVGTVTFMVYWRDPAVASQWLRQIVQRLNLLLRERAKTEAEANLRYLEMELAKTSVVGVRETIFRLVEGEVKAIMLANTRSEFAFKVIDPPVTPDSDEHVFPNRLLFSAIGGLLALLIMSAAILIRQGRA